jgi:hypothetical protein
MHAPQADGPVDKARLTPVGRAVKRRRGVGAGRPMVDGQRSSVDHQHRALSALAPNRFKDFRQD